MSAMCFTDQSQSALKMKLHIHSPLVYFLSILAVVFNHLCVTELKHPYSWNKLTSLLLSIFREIGYTHIICSRQRVNKNFHLQSPMIAGTFTSECPEIVWNQIDAKII